MKQLLKVLKLLKSVFFSVGILTVGCTQVLEIDGNQFSYENKPFKMWGIRVASASQNEENTKLLLSSLDDYKENGLTAFQFFSRDQAEDSAILFLKTGK